MSRWWARQRAEQSAMGEMIPVTVTLPPMVAHTWAAADPQSRRQTLGFAAPVTPEWADAIHRAANPRVETDPYVSNVLTVMGQSYAQKAAEVIDASLCVSQNTEEPEAPAPRPRPKFVVVTGTKET